MFEVLLMNIGLGLGTAGLIQLIVVFSPLVNLGLHIIVLGLLYVFFYILLLIGVAGVDAIILRKGIDYYYEQRT